VLADTPDVEQLEQDLAQLARHRLGFQHPTALTGLRHLLGLAVVEREAGYNADLPEARVLALRPVLQKVITRVRNPTTREALQIYFFLDDEPLNYGPRRSPLVALRSSGAYPSRTSSGAQASKTGSERSSRVSYAAMRSSTASRARRPFRPGPCRSSSLGPLPSCALSWSGLSTRRAST
jgi:hypothetical protein